VPNSKEELKEKVNLLGDKCEEISRENKQLREIIKSKDTDLTDIKKILVIFQKDLHQLKLQRENNVKKNASQGHYKQAKSYYPYNQAQAKPKQEKKFAVKNENKETKYIVKHGHSKQTKSLPKQRPQETIETLTICSDNVDLEQVKDLYYFPNMVAKQIETRLPLPKLDLKYAQVELTIQSSEEIQQQENDTNNENMDSFQLNEDNIPNHIATDAKSVGTLNQAFVMESEHSGHNFNTTEEIPSPQKPTIKQNTHSTNFSGTFSKPNSTGKQFAINIDQATSQGPSFQNEFLSHYNEFSTSWKEDCKKMKGFK